ncbi:MAG TPA: HEAT repeat domain-containing protein, partial [Blastocatellia bacterium]|nr:HEAT repeat domain-containing protein [Blastocatellia bacterium]
MVIRIHPQFLTAALAIALCVAPALQASAAQAGPPAERVTAALKDAAPSTRREAANQLGALRARNAVRPLIEALKDKEAGVREAAAFALGQIASPSAVDALARLLADKDADARAAAVFALGMIGDRKSLPAIADALDDTDTNVRSSAVIALGLMQDETAVDELVQMLGDANFDPRYDAAWALGEIGEADAEDALRATAATIDELRLPEVWREPYRQTVKNALASLRTTEHGTPSRPRRATGIIAEPSRYSSATQPARVRQQVAAAPTEKSLRAKVAGAVGLRLMVAADGRPARAYVIRRLGYG